MQHDTHGDGYGNQCEPELNGDMKIEFQDLSLLKHVFFIAGENMALTSVSMARSIPAVWRL